MHQHYQTCLLLSQHQLSMDDITGGLAPGNVHGSGWDALSGGFHVPYKNGRSSDSAMATTTRRRPADEGQVLPGAAASSATATSPLAQQLVLQLHHQSVDIDDLIRLQNETLRSELEEMRERHRRALLSATQKGVLHHLRQKVTELESAKRRNVELEEKVSQLAAENEMWLNVARNNEAIASNLRACLEQVLLKKVDLPLAGAIMPLDLEEGYGDSGSVTPATVRVAEDAQPCFCHGDPAVGKRGKREKCRVCWEGEVSVLVLPCRHLCLCQQCEPRVAACPLCKAAINATLHVFFG